MRTLYLDTADLSYLLKGRGPGGAAQIAEQRARLEALVRAERARLCVSLVHLAEIAVDPRTRDAALLWMETGPTIWCFTTAADAIFRAELLGESLSIQVSVLTRAAVEDLRVPLRIPGLTIGGARIARTMKRLTGLMAHAENVSKRARRRPAGMTARRHASRLAEEGRATDRLLRGDVDWMPAPARAVAHAFRALIAASGFTIEDVRRHRSMGPGRSWIAGLVSPAHWDAADGMIRDPIRAPASALRAAIEDFEAGDPGRRSRSSTVYDVNHLAYAARCDVATIDGANLRATASVRAKLGRPKLFEVAHLDSVLDEIERP